MCMRSVGTGHTLALLALDTLLHFWHLTHSRLIVTSQEAENQITPDVAMRKLRLGTLATSYDLRPSTF